MNYSDETADEFARLQDQIDAAGAWELDQMLDQAMDALRCPPGEADVTSFERWREAPRGAGATAALAARPAAAGRAHEPPGRRVRGVARAAPGRLQGHDRRGHPRSLLPRQRRGLDPRARPRVGPPLQGQLLLVARAEAEAARAGGEVRVGAPAHDQGRARVGAHQPQGPPHQVPCPPEPLRGPAGRGAQRQARRRPDPHPARAAARRDRDRGGSPAEGLRRQAADRGPVLHAAARGDRRRDRAQRRRQDDAVPHDRRRGEARLRLDAPRRDGRTGLRRPVA